MIRTSPAPEMPTEVERKLYTGMLKVYVMAINPSLEEIKSMRYNPDKEPVYEGKGSREVNGVKVEHPNYRVDFWLRNDEKDITIRHSIWVSKEDASPSSKGNIQVTNDTFQSTWISEECFANKVVPHNKKGEAWFTLPFRVAKEGEVELRSFVSAWTNQTKDKVAVPVKFGEIIKGNLKTLFDICGTERDTFLGVMLGVRTAPNGKQYQAISRTVFNHWVSPQKVWEQIKEETGSNNYEVDKYTFIPSDFQIREFKGYGNPPAGPSQQQGFTSEQVVRDEYKIDFGKHLKNSDVALPPGTLPPAGGDDSELPF